MVMIGVVQAIAGNSAIRLDAAERVAAAMLG